METSAISTVSSAMEAASQVGGDDSHAPLKIEASLLTAKRGLEGDGNVESPKKKKMRLVHRVKSPVILGRCMAYLEKDQLKVVTENTFTTEDIMPEKNNSNVFVYSQETVARARFVPYDVVKTSCVAINLHPDLTTDLKVYVDMKALLEFLWTNLEKGDCETQFVMYVQLVTLLQNIDYTRHRLSSIVKREFATTTPPEFVRQLLSVLSLKESKCIYSVKQLLCEALDSFFCTFYAGHENMSAMTPGRIISGAFFSCPQHGFKASDTEPAFISRIKSLPNSTASPSKCKNMFNSIQKSFFALAKRVAIVHGKSCENVAELAAKIVEGMTGQSKEHAEEILPSVIATLKVWVPNGHSKPAINELEDLLKYGKERHLAVASAKRQQKDNATKKEDSETKMPKEEVTVSSLEEEMLGLSDVKVE